MSDPTADEIARAKRWAAMQTPEVTVTEYHANYGHEIDEWPDWMGDDVVDLHPSADAAWSALALALRPVFASVGLVIREECAAVCDAEAYNARTRQDHNDAHDRELGYLVSSNLAAAIRAMQ
jgi:hypothetical protein